MDKGEPDQLVDVVTVSKLSAYLDAVDSSRQNRRLRAACAFDAIIKNILGEEWFSKNATQNLADRRTLPGYIGYDFSDPKSAEIKTLRMHDLSEMLLNLQLVPGFHDRVSQLKNLSLIQIESAYAEFQVASILYWHGLNFRFVEKDVTARKGEDYDFEVSRNSAIIAIEAKCKFESTQVDARSIAGSLKEAQSQLPKDGPSSIFVKIPSHWFAEGGTLNSEIERETRRFFGSTGRVMSIVYYTPFHSFDDSAVRTNHKYREIENFRCRYRHIAQSLFKGFGAMKEWDDGRPRWITLMDIIEGKI